MHRTEGDGYVLESGKRRFIDQNLPSVPGTVDTGEYNNAVQEELCNLIELSGGTIATGASSDRSAGWHQVYDQIFEGGHITDLAIDELTFNIISGGIIDIQEIVGSITNNWEQDIDGLLYTQQNSSTGDDYFASYSALGSLFQYLGIGLGIYGLGIQYIDGPGNNEPVFRKATYLVNDGGISWSTIDATNGTYRATLSLVVDIPPSQVPVDKIFQITVSSNFGSTQLKTWPASCLLTDNNPTTDDYIISRITVISETTTPGTEFTITFMYDATNLDDSP